MVSGIGLILMFRDFVRDVILCEWCIFLLLLLNSMILFFFCWGSFLMVSWSVLWILVLWGFMMDFRFRVSSLVFSDVLMDGCLLKMIRLVWFLFFILVVVCLINVLVFSC